MKHQHLVVTRYTVRGWAYDEFSPEWLEERLRLFRTYCVPSMAQQTEEEFVWVVLCDEGTDRGYVAEIEASRESVPQLRIVATSLERKVHITQAIRSTIDPDADLLITTRLDNDDALHAAALATAQDYVEPFLRSPHQAWVLHSPRGYRYDETEGQLYAAYWMNSPFISMFEKLDPDRNNLRHVYRVQHPKVPQTVPIHNDESIPGWVQVLHGLAESTQPDTLSGAVLTGGNRRSKVREIDLEIDRSEVRSAFGLALEPR
jgi:hypothetical protein